jgi:L-fuconolactonase
VDAHRHLWDRPEFPYLLPDLLTDAAAGHSIRASVFVECRSRYWRDGDRAFRSLGETEFATAVGDESDETACRTSACAGIVGFVDLQAGGDVVPRLLDAHIATARGRLRGIRNLSAFRQSRAK